MCELNSMKLAHISSKDENDLYESMINQIDWELYFDRLRYDVFPAPTEYRKINGYFIGAKSQNYRMGIEHANSFFWLDSEAGAYSSRVTRPG